MSLLEPNAHEVGLDGLGSADVVEEEGVVVDYDDYKDEV
jgi:hypothetical protein